MIQYRDGGMQTQQEPSNAGTECQRGCGNYILGDSHDSMTLVSQALAISTDIEWRGLEGSLRFRPQL